MRLSVEVVAFTSSIWFTVVVPPVRYVTPASPVPDAP